LPQSLFVQHHLELEKPRLILPVTLSAKQDSEKDVIERNVITSSSLKLSYQDG